ncbi:MAG: phosphoglycerate mutase family protein [Nevskia sp.]|nr:phosphoglycerate mutase family protein [Nevskia sp.]
MTRLVLVRHGQASFGARNYDELSAIGERQGTLLGEHWRRHGRHFDAAWSGDMVRQKVTAARTFEAMGAADSAVTVDAAFNEFDHQQLIRAYFPLVAKEHPQFSVNPKTLFSDHDTFQRLFDLIVACWIEQRSGAAPVDESWEAFQARCLEGLRRVADSGARQAVVFTSGGVITAVLRAALNLNADKAFHLNWEILNASVHSFRLGKRGVMLQRFNDVAHLELLRDESLLTYR